MTPSEWLRAWLLARVPPSYAAKAAGVTLAEALATQRELRNAGEIPVGAGLAAHPSFARAMARQRLWRSTPSPTSHLECDP